MPALCAQPINQALCQQEGNRGQMASLPDNLTLSHDNITGIATLWNGSHKNEILGIILSIVGSFLISISLNLQKYTHVRLARQENPIPYYKSKLWWCGVLLMGVGELGNFAAYGFAPATLIAPLGCVAVIGSAAISVLFLKESMRASDVIGGTLAVIGTYLLVTFSPNVSQDVTATKVERYVVSWQFLLYLALEIITFCLLLYFYKRRGVNHIVVLLLLVALLASVAVISVKAVAGMIAMTLKGDMQLTYAIFYVMLVLMVASCVFQVKFLNQAMQLYNATEVVPINYVFFTTSAILADYIPPRVAPMRAAPSDDNYTDLHSIVKIAPAVQHRVLGSFPLHCSIELYHSDPKAKIPLDQDALSLLGKGLSFSPVCGGDEFTVYHDLCFFLRRVAFKLMFGGKSESTAGGQEIPKAQLDLNDRALLRDLVSLKDEAEGEGVTEGGREVLNPNPTGAKRKSKYMPPLNHKLKTFRDLVQRDLHTVKWAPLNRKDNLTRGEREALEKLKQRDKIIIRESDKGGNVVLLSAEYYEGKCLSLLSDQDTRSCRKIPEHVRLWLRYIDDVVLVWRGTKETLDKCLLSFIGVFLIARNQEKRSFPETYIDFGEIPGKETVGRIQPDPNSPSYGSLLN
ncbi:LOW QUALITY PROTEIN: NIPA-like protein 2 [Hyperolius riggenbachi]|uniref:LOW QUALITY PROTEIN: NIPA-like protein 2 n=1 Tax=Hyperolius riggenbachi TaxID=752182 RepID=UPI0035A27465